MDRYIQFLWNNFCLAIVNYSLIFCPPYPGSAAVLQCCRRVSTAVKMVRGAGAGADQAPVRPRPQQRQHTSQHSDSAVPGVHTQGANIFNVPQNIFDALTNI